MQTFEEKYGVTSLCPYQFSLEFTNEAIRKTVDDYNEIAGENDGVDYFENAMCDLYMLGFEPIKIYPDRRVVAVFAPDMKLAEWAFSEIQKVCGDGVRKVEI